MKTVVILLLFTSLAVLANAQGKHSKTKPKGLMEEIEKEREKPTKSIPSPFDGLKNKSLNPLPPMCRDVYKSHSIDSGNIRILYALNATNIADPQTYDDLQRLEIGTKYSKYYSHYVFQRDSSISSGNRELNRKYNLNMPMELDNATGGVTMIINGKFQGWSESLFAEFFKDLSTNELTEYCRMPQGCGNYLSQYTEPMPTQNWQMQEETQTVAGYMCQKAICDFRGRKYTAWFAVDIPISQGPWKFGGLPGLIMKVYDSKEEYVFECVGIENHPDKFPIMLMDTYKTMYSKTTRIKLNKLLKNIQENYYRLAGLHPVSNEIFPPLNPHNPIELD